MAGLGISRRRLAQVQGGPQHAGVLAGTVVMDTARVLTGQGHCCFFFIGLRRLRTAFQVIARQFQPTQPFFDRAGMNRLPIVRRTGQGQFRIADQKVLGRPRLQQRQGLQRLDGRTGIDDAVRITPRCRHLTPGRTDSHGAPVNAFHHVAAGDFDQNRIDCIHYRHLARHKGSREVIRFPDSRKTIPSVPWTVPNSSMLSGA